MITEHDTLSLSFVMSCYRKKKSDETTILKVLAMILANAEKDTGLEKRGPVWERQVMKG